MQGARERVNTKRLEPERRFSGGVQALGVALGDLVDDAQGAPALFHRPEHAVQPQAEVFQAASRSDQGGEAATQAFDDADAGHKAKQPGAQPCEHTGETRAALAGRVKLRRMGRRLFVHPVKRFAGFGQLTLDARFSAGQVVGFDARAVERLHVPPEFALGLTVFGVGDALGGARLLYREGVFGLGLAGLPAFRAQPLVLGDGAAEFLCGGVSRPLGVFEAVDSGFLTTEIVQLLIEFLPFSA